jgi:histidinol-phosphatase
MGPGSSGRTWIVDPIDGTNNFAAGVPLWSTLIALAVDGRPVLGLVDIPLLRRRYHAVRGGGAWRNGAPVSVSGVERLAEALVLHSGVEEWTSGAGLGLDAFLRVVEGCRRTRGLSDAVGHMLVADGSADVLLERSPCGEWDWAACMVIVEEAGGRMTTLDGDAPSPGCTLLVSNGPLHGPVQGLLRP